MNDWKCGKCGREYSSEEFTNMPRVKAVESDTDPIKQHGFTGKCQCGYVFGKDKWQLRKSIEIKDYGKVDISTVFLELNHFGYWYETMVFPERGDLICNFQTRYKTKKEAEEGHKNLVNKIKKNHYIITPSEYELELEV